MSVPSPENPRHFPGRLCPNGHDWQGTGQSLRFRDGHCVECGRERRGNQPRQSIVDRFWSKVDRSGGVDACWPWTGGRRSGGYGNAYLPSEPYRMRQIGAHRLAWILTHGEIPDGLCVCHRCDNPPCCNPAHLWLGTSEENSYDRHAKGRSAQGGTSGPGRHPEKYTGEYNRGSLHPLAKLNEEQVKEIRARAVYGETHLAISRIFGVSRETVGGIVNRKRWKHVA